MENTVYKAFMGLEMWWNMASSCIYRLEGASDGSHTLARSGCMHKKRIGRNCSIVNCPLGRSSDEKPKELIKGIW